MTLFIGLFTPLVGFLFLFLFGSKVSRQIIGWIGCLTVFLSFLCFLGLFFSYSQPLTFTLFSWLPVKGIDANFSLHLDSLSLLMSLIITGIGFLIHVFSIGYMEHDEDLGRYFACMNFFIFSMLLLVLAEHVLVLFVGWEGVGLASYLLIGFWYHRPAAAQAATKAFVMNRIGDVGLLIGLLLIFYLFGTGNISEISQRLSQFSPGLPIFTLLTLLLFWGAIGKSAQIPLHTWLPDAMEGPTPVSALIHAATMVTAGVYLVVRLHTLFLLSPITLQVIGVIGATTSLFAALCATGQIDLKRVLAYSTVSQLGLMFLACSVGAFYTAMFHLTTHAFVKALLFLSAGNAIHMLHGETEMEKMGGLSQKFKKTDPLFLIGILAMAGLPPLAAFFSKDLILEAEHLLGFQTLFLMALLTSILTAFYLMRAYCLTFKGKPRSPAIFEEAHEAPSIMLIPVAILALLSIVGGFLGFGFTKMAVLETFLEPITGILPLEKELGNFHLFLIPETWLTIAGSLLGLGISFYMYTKAFSRLRGPFSLLKNGFFVNQIYESAFVHPLEYFSRFIAFFMEPKLFERSIQWIAKGTENGARFLQHFQSGQIRSYFAWMIIGMVLLIVYLIV